MRILFLLLLMSLVVRPAFSQTPEKNMSKQEMKHQIADAIKQLNDQIVDLEKQIAEAKKNKGDSESLKEMEDELAMLKKQVALMGGVNKNLSSMSDKTFQQANDEEPLVPKRDVIRINSIPKKILTEAELSLFINNVHAQVEKFIPAEEKREAVKIYDETKSVWKSASAITNAATGCWLYGHWEKALYLQGRACLDNMKDPNNLNNYASYLTMTGAEHAAIPILLYLDNKYPNNSTIANNIGQAWYGLGDMNNAKKFLESATALYPSHSMANLTLSSIYKSQGDSGKAVAALQASIRKCYTSDKEEKLKDLGYEIDEDDIEFPYPLDEDLLGIDPFWNEFPPIPGNVTECKMAEKQWEAFKEACDLLLSQTRAKEAEAEVRTKVFMAKMNDPEFHQPVLYMHNNQPHNVAERKLILATIHKKSALSIEEVMAMAANAYHNTTTERLNALQKKHDTELRNLPKDHSCDDEIAIHNNFLSQAKTVMDEGVAAMKKVYDQNNKKIRTYIRLIGYSTLNDYGSVMNQFSHEVWKANQWISTYQANFISSFKSLIDNPVLYYPCTETPEVPKQTKVLPQFKIPDCPHSATVKLPVGKIMERCNTIDIDISKLKMRKNNSQKGEVELTMGEPVRVEAGEVELTMGEPVRVEADQSGNIHINTNNTDGQSTNNSNVIKSTVNSGVGSMGSSTGFGGRISILR